MEDLYCHICKNYTYHENFICSKCETEHDPKLKRYVICGPNDNPEVIEAKDLFLKENEDAIIIDEDVAFKHRTGMSVFDNPPNYIQNIDMDLMKGAEDFKYGHLTKKEKEAIIEPVRVGPKVRRNEPCPCGKLRSDGKRIKYKKCCLNKK